MPSLVASGIVIPRKCRELELQQEKARRVIDAGPEPLAQSDVHYRRYVLTDTLDDLMDAEDEGRRNAILSRLHELLGDFHLRAHGEWSGQGKALLRSLRVTNETLAIRYESEFARAFRGEPLADLIALVDEILSPFGGRLWDGYRAKAPADWKAIRDGER